MGLADNLEQENLNNFEQSGQAAPSFEQSQKSATEAALAEQGMESPTVSVNENPELAINAARQEIVAEPQSDQDIFVKKVSEVLLSEKEEPLESFVRVDKKAEFHDELNKFISKYFWDPDTQLDMEKIDEEKLKNLLLKDLYLVYLDNVNEYFVEQMALKDANKLLKFFKENI